MSVSQQELDYLNGVVNAKSSHKERVDASDDADYLEEVLLEHRRQVEVDKARKRKLAQGE